MDRLPKSLTDAVHLLRTCEVLTAAVRTVVDEWSKESRSHINVLPSHKLHDAQRTVLAATGTLTELTSEPHSRVVEVACQYWESRALAIAAERKIADLLVKAGDKGLSTRELGAATGIESRKLSRILRCLCSIHIFREVRSDVFANNVVSAALIGNEPLRAYVLMFNSDLYTASDHLPAYLLGAKGHSYSVTETAWQDAVGTVKPRWDWLEEDVSREEASTRGPGYPGLPAVDDLYRSLPHGAKLRRPEHGIFSLAMIGGGRIFGAAHPYDYPWEDLGTATIVDVGGGLGGFDIQMSSLYPNLKFIIQDRGPVLQQAEQVTWPKDAPAAIAQGRVEFVEHDFFLPNPVHGAEVYWLRYILHDWSDDYCVKILSAIRTAMAPHSRILICDQVMNTTNGCAELVAAPAPLPANYGYYTRYSHQRDLCMMSIINGIERTPAQFEVLIDKAGMKLEKIWECRSQSPTPPFIGLLQVDHALLPDETLEQFQANVFGPLNVYRAVLPYLRKQRSGTLATIGSMAAWYPMVSCNLYDTSKAAISWIAKGLESETAGFGIKHCLIEPGFFRTKLLSPAANIKKTSEGRTQEDYAELNKENDKAFAAFNGNQAGNPVKGAEIIYDVLTSSGVAKGREIPSELALGIDAVAEVQKSAQKTIDGINEWASISCQSDYPEGH